MQPFSQPETLKETLIENRKQMKTNKKVVREILSLYLANEETEHILWKPVQVCRFFFSFFYFLCAIHF